MLGPCHLFPILFTQHCWPCALLFDSSPHRIHSPRRILHAIGGGLALVPNSTTPPVRISPSSVLMSFDVAARNGRHWNARILTSRKDECDLFLMDRATLQPLVLAKLKASLPGIGPPTVSVSITVFDAASFIGMLAMSVWCKIRKSHAGLVFHRLDLVQHRQYMQMALHINKPTRDNNNKSVQSACKA